MESSKAESRVRSSDLVALAGRYPGSAPDSGVSGFWETIKNSKDLPSTVPLQRWDVDDYYSPEAKGKQLSMYVRMAAFVDNLDQFDASMFRYGSPGINIEISNLARHYLNAEHLVRYSNSFMA